MTKQNSNNHKCRKQIFISNDTDEMLKDCVQDYLQHHPEMEQIPISYNKIVYEIAKFYLRY